MTPKVIFGSGAGGAPVPAGLGSNKAGKRPYEA